MPTVAGRPTEIGSRTAEDPFPLVLRAAIGSSGLSLDRIRYRLGLRGVSISVPTLSHWQSGRRRPERPESLRALIQLEQVLSLPPDALRSLLGRPRPRGRVRTAAWFGQVSQHDRMEIAVRGGVKIVHSRLVLLAGGGGVDRWTPVWESGADEVPALVGDRHCRIGVVGFERGTGRASGELILDSPLAGGESTVVEYRIVYPETKPGLAGNRFIRRFDGPVRDYVVEAVFDRESLPRRCFRVNIPRGAVSAVDVEELAPTAAGSVHFVDFDVTGSVGIRWEW